MQLNTTQELIEDIRLGKMVVLMDDEDRENEGDIVIAADKISASEINFMATHARGLICLTLTSERCKQLQLPLMVSANQTLFGTNFTVSIEAAEGVTTGISAADRARTIQAAVAPDAAPTDITLPGHIFPLMAKEGGVLRRAGHTEAGCDLARLAGLTPASAICEIMNADGSMARRADLEKFAEEHGLKIGTIMDLVHYRIANEQTVDRIQQYPVETEHGHFDIYCYRDTIKEGEPTHLALVKGKIDSEEPVLVRVIVTNILRDLLSIKDPRRSSWPLHRAMEKINQEGKGVVVILAGEENNSSILNQLESFSAEAESKVSAKASQGMFLNVGTGSQILRDLGVGKMRLMSYPTKYAISGFDLEVVEYILYEE
jgi:3,4-dihydroxy 2-butanone 4-phosphate synthase / GTP cyclohydrolase II